MNLRNVLLTENSHIQNEDYIPHNSIYVKLQETQI